MTFDKKKKLLLNAASLLAFGFALLLVIKLYKYRHVITYESIFWIIALIFAVTLLLGGSMLAYSARKCGKKKVHVRFG